MHVARPTAFDAAVTTQRGSSSSWRREVTSNSGHKKLRKSDLSWRHRRQSSLKYGRNDQLQTVQVDAIDRSHTGRHRQTYRRGVDAYIEL